MKTVSKSHGLSSDKTERHADTNGRNGVATVSDLTPNPEGPLPPLPNPIPFAPQSVPFPSQPSFPIPVPIGEGEPSIFTFRSLREGCYLLNYTPHPGGFGVTYDGTMRVEKDAGNTIASGDLYHRPFIVKQGIPPIIFPGLPPNPAAGIPIFRRDRYRYYIEVTQILEGITFGNNFTLGFTKHRFNNGAWIDEGKFTAVMSWIPAPAGYPSSGNYLTGDVKNSSGMMVGKLTMGWVSKYLRKATLEIDRVSVSETPLNNGAGVDWRGVFEQVGWDLTVQLSNTTVTEPSGAAWSYAELHDKMLAYRASSNLDSEWRYHLLCVREMDESDLLGVMYDHPGSDSNNIPREGAGVASHFMFDNGAHWGLVKNTRLGTTTPYFRTAVHEIGHAMGLYHNSVDNGFMKRTTEIALNAVPPTQFPNNVQWSHASDDQKRLRHMPDIYVRPGGTPFGTSYSATPISPNDMVMEAEGLKLQVSPLLESVPLGAPVRVNIALVNISNDPLLTPVSLNMKKGFVKGKVVDPSGTARSFSPIVLCVDDNPLRLIEPGMSISDSLTLLRGGQGTLFPSPGVHRIIVEAHWDINGMECTVSGETNVMVTGVIDKEHAQAALKVLSTPDVLLTLVFGGDHLADGINAVQTALKSKVLRPHFAFIEAKRVAERFGKRKPNLKATAELIDDATVMSPAEIKKAAKLLKGKSDNGETGNGAVTKSISRTLKSKVKAIDVSDKIKDLIEAL